jgi:hypothetical protein
MELLHYSNDDWVVLCQVCYLFADCISKMAATGQPSFPHYWPWQPYWISNLYQNNRSGVEPSKEHSHNAKNSICQVVSQKKVFEWNSHRVQTFLWETTQQIEYFALFECSLDGPIPDLLFWSRSEIARANNVFYFGFPIHTKIKRLVEDHPVIISIMLQFHWLSSFWQEDL